MLVGIIDTGIDAAHPDLAPNFDAALSRNFTTDIPLIDGACEAEPDQSCSDPSNVDEGGHGTHVSGIVAAAANGIGVAGVAPDATLVNLRAGQDSGFFFFFETVAAITYAADNGIDVVNMSFYTDPWLYNCDSADDILSGTVTPAELAQQALIRQGILDAVAYARSHGVTLVAAAGNQHLDLSAPTRFDDTSPDFPPNTAKALTVTNDCLDLPSEAPGVIQVSSIGPSKVKADYSTWGLGAIDVAAPGGWFRDFFGTNDFMEPENMVLSSYPLAVAQEEGGVNRSGGVRDPFYKRDCIPGGDVRLLPVPPGHVHGIASCRRRGGADHPGPRHAGRRGRLRPGARRRVRRPHPHGRQHGLPGPGPARLHPGGAPGVVERHVHRHARRQQQLRRGHCQRGRGGRPVARSLVTATAMFGAPGQPGAPSVARTQRPGLGSRPSKRPAGRRGR